MKYSIISLNNIIIAIKEANSIAELKANNQEYNNNNYIIIPFEEHHVEGLDLNNYKPMSNKEKIEKGIIKLAPNQIFDEANDYIGTATEFEKIINNEIVKKTYLEQYNDKLITKEEFLEKVNIDRGREYKENIDSLTLELVRSYFNSLDPSLLTQEQKELLSNINTKVSEIKIKNPK